jgi:hypothetical protein
VQHTKVVIEGVKEMAKRDIDLIIEDVKRRLPDVEVEQLQVTHPGNDDDGLWYFSLPGIRKTIQIESTYGVCPFLVEHHDMESSWEAETAQSVSEAVHKVVTYLTGLRSNNPSEPQR